MNSTYKGIKIKNISTHCYVLAIQNGTNLQAYIPSTAMDLNDGLSVMSSIDMCDELFRHINIRIVLHSWFHYWSIYVVLLLDCLPVPAIGTSLSSHNVTPSQAQICL